MALYRKFAIPCAQMDTHKQKLADIDTSLHTFWEEPAPISPGTTPVFGEAY